MVKKFSYGTAQPLGPSMPAWVWIYWDAASWDVACVLSPFIVEVDTSTNCHLSHELIGQTSTLRSINYVQPMQRGTSALAMVAVPPLPPTLIEDDNNDTATSRDMALDTVTWPNMVLAWVALNHLTRMQQTEPPPPAKLICMMEDDIVSTLHPPNT